MGNVFRTVSHDGSLRGVTIDATDVVSEIVAAQQPLDAMKSLGAEAVVACTFIQRLMSPGKRLQLTVQSNDGRIFVDAREDGTLRGLITGRVTLGEGTFLSVTRVLKNGELHTGTVDTRADIGLKQSIAAYMDTSEQMPSLLDIYVADDLSIVGGWMIQALPGHDLETIAEVLDHMGTLPEPSSLWRSDVEQIATIAMGIPHRLHPEDPISFSCDCSKDRVLSALRTLPNTELAEMATSEEALTIDCDYCSETYVITSPEITRLM